MDVLIEIIGYTKLQISTDAVRNFSSNAFALASKHNYFDPLKQEFFSDLAKGSILFWTKIQHPDGVI